MRLARAPVVLRAQETPERRLNAEDREIAARNELALAGERLSINREVGREQDVRGQDRDLDPEVAERGMAFMSTGLTDENRGPAFGPEVQAPGDAPVYVRLAAVAGRAP